MKAPVSVVIPCYRSAQSVPLVVEQLKPMFAAEGRDYEVILVEDGSRDGTWEAIQALVRDNTNVRGYRMLRNYGQHNALLCGVRQARFPLLVTMDDDLQNPPSQVPRLIEKLEQGFDVVYGTPKRQSHGFLRDMASTMTKIALQNVMGAETARNISAFRAFRTEVRHAFDDYKSPLVSIDVLLTWGAHKFTAIEVEHAARTIGASNYSFARLLTHAMNMMTGFSTAPLRAASYMGFALTFFGVIVMVWVLGRYIIQGSSVPGFPFLASIVTIFSGAQLLTLGVFGEYLARIHLRTMERPCYTVSEAAEGPDSASVRYSDSPERMQERV